MIRVENYPNAYKEVYVILNNMESEYVEKVPQIFIEMVEHNMNKEYQFEIDMEKDFEDQELLQETRAILAYMFIHYWGSEQEKLEIKEQFKKDIIEAERNKGTYNRDELFNKTRKYDLDNNDNAIKEQENLSSIDRENSMVKYQKNSVFSKLINKLKSLFK